MTERRRPDWLSLRDWKRHSLVLAVAGTVYICTGVTYMTTEPTNSRLSALRVAIDWMPLSAWGIVFMLVGALAILSSRWPPASETWGYTALTSLSIGWAGFYLCAIPLGAPAGQNFTGALAWGLLGFLWWAISGLVNPDGRA
jgi:hypothetical protein